MVGFGKPTFFGTSNPVLYQNHWHIMMSPEILSELLQQKVHVETFWDEVGGSKKKNLGDYRLYDVEKNLLIVVIPMQSDSQKYREHLERLGWAPPTVQPDPISQAPKK